MPRPNEHQEQMLKSLLPNLKDYISSLPKPEQQRDLIWGETPIDLETWLYDPAFMNLASITFSPIQMGAMHACDDITWENKYDEFVLEWAKGSHGFMGEVTDLATNETKTYREWAADGRSLLLKTWNGREIELRQSGPVRSMGVKPCFRVSFDDGRSCDVSSTHRFQTPEGWKRLDELSPGGVAFCSSSNVPRESRYVPREMRTTEDFLSGYRRACRLRGERSLRGVNTDRSIVPSTGGVQVFDRSSKNTDVHQAQTQQRTLSRNRLAQSRKTMSPSASREDGVRRPLFQANAAPSLPARRSPQTPIEVLRPLDTGSLWLRCGGLVAVDHARHSVVQGYASRYPSSLIDIGSYSYAHQDARRSEDHQGPVDITQRLQAKSSSVEVCNSDTSPSGSYLSIKSISSLGEQECYDLTMPTTGCYFGDNGILHHNSGKDTIAALMALRQVYKLLCLRDVYGYYGLVPGSGIELTNVAYTKQQAKEVYFKQFRGFLLGSRWFVKQNPNIKAESIHFNHGITVLSKAADGDSVEGQNMFFGVMDEASAFKDASVVKAMNKAEGEKVQSNAEGIYKVLRSSTTSRFKNVGKVVIISYPRYIDDFTQTKRKENENRETGWTSGPYATWEVNPRVTKADFAEAYRRNPELAEAMYECRPAHAEHGYVKHPDRMVTAIARGRDIGLVNPIDEFGAFSPDFYGEPGKFYAIHVDLAMTRDKCAMALACQGRPERRMKCPCNAFNLKDVSACVKCERPISQWMETWLPTVVFPMIRIFDKSGSKNEVSFSEVREEILWIRDRKHHIWSLTYDGWQSADSIQIMGQILGTRRVPTTRYAGPKDFKEEDVCQVLSVDRNTEAHDTLKDFIYDYRAFIMPGSDRDPRDKDNEDVTALAYREWSRLKSINARKIDHPLGGCFVGETRIPLLDGSLPMISELDGRSGFWVYSCAPDGTIVSGKAKGFISKHVTELVDVVLDSGAVARCTPDHRWMLRDGTYKQAKDLIPDIDRLMPVTRQWPRNGGYECVSDKYGQRIPTHRMVMQNLEGLDIKSRLLVHHLDECKTNNDPENLEIIDQSKHASHHTSESHANDHAYKQKVAAGLQVWNLSERGRHAHSTAMKRSMANMTTEQLQKRARAHKKFRPDINAVSLETVKDKATSADRASKLLGCGRNVVIRVLRDMGFACWDDFAKTPTGANYRVRYVIPVTLEHPIPVYDLEVERWNNFALSCGVFVHNSKDVVDAMAGAALMVSRMPMTRSRPPMISGWRDNHF